MKKFLHKYEIKYRVVPYGNMWRVQFKDFWWWRNYTGKFLGGNPVNFFDKADAELQIKLMKDDWNAMIQQTKDLFSGIFRKK